MTTALSFKDGEEIRDAPVVRHQLDQTVVHYYSKVYGDGSHTGPYRLERTLIVTAYSFETIAGIFDDCVIIREDYYDIDELLEDTVYTILAYGVGPILCQVDDEDLDELIAILD